ncbi:hypothetical protein METBIDRAFT_186579 [Metschnikowia bicuspidata var. bicuspidata NRRL YB-4993]|uniref:Transmembrane protein n=1 Tax=Metschnikowia bicuspidata var. bicuspidata NRRL YB-4993 TaxID=869754 RepID=A0A1A0HC68_9ASCO|nr:hypothetical protein METBIDRAFT_186579 [Metschnikowia bicuspidata var. bicuspidata NRRL YB-4993]OBA21483.1 hypothetical protein METBIDRAFT_186579 [Metschnikowia bicuspidata var. bicuspidata NRRL YB-4993]
MSYIRIGAAEKRFGRQTHHQKSRGGTWLSQPVQARDVPRVEFCTWHACGAVCRRNTLRTRVVGCSEEASRAKMSFFIFGMVPALLWCCMAWHVRMCHVLLGWLCFGWEEHISPILPFFVLVDFAI